MYLEGNDWEMGKLGWHHIMRALNIKKRNSGIFTYSENSVQKSREGFSERKIYGNKTAY